MHRWNNVRLWFITVSVSAGTFSSPEAMALSVTQKRMDLFPGSLGTAGRVCNKSSRGTDGCEVMCCGRGYDTMRVKRVTKCECKFKWCCAVECSDCEDVVDVHTCKPHKRADWLDIT